jgi:RNA recognition motif. (a.k.a. RRM, RBD, or RNP domain)
MFRIIIQDAKNVTITCENSHDGTSQITHLEEIKYFEIRRPIDNNSMDFLPQTRSFFEEAKFLPKGKNNVKKYKNFPNRKNNFPREKYKVSLDKELPFPRKRKNILTEKQQKIFDELNEELDNINKYHEKQHKVFKDLDNRPILTSESGNVLFIKNFPDDIRRSEIHEIFKTFKGYEDINCEINGVYVKFKTSVDAGIALVALNGNILGGNKLKIQRLSSHFFPLNLRYNKSKLTESNRKIAGGI